MEQRKVPQHNISTYANNKKAMYATDENGKYCVVASSGWDVEEAVTKQALRELQRLASEAHSRVSSGEASPLYYHMYARRMDPQILSESTGIYKWRIKRHFKPAVFAGLSEKIYRRYAEALGISIETLCKLPERVNSSAE
jgi:hypothetical protein